MDTRQWPPLGEALGHPCGPLLTATHVRCPHKGPPYLSGTWGPLPLQKLAGSPTGPLPPAPGLTLGSLPGPLMYVGSVNPVNPEVLVSVKSPGMGQGLSLSPGSARA